MAKTHKEKEKVRSWTIQWCTKYASLSLVWMGWYKCAVAHMNNIVVNVPTVGQ